MLHAGEASHAGIVALVRAATTDDALRRLDRTVAQPLPRNRILFGARIESIHRANAGRDEDRECAKGQAPDEHASNVHGCILLSAALRGSGQKARSSGPDGREISKVGECDEAGGYRRSWSLRPTRLRQNRLPCCQGASAPNLKKLERRTG